MLQIVRSNTIESLLDQFASCVSSAPLSSPFSPEVVVVPSPAMARWINLELAQRHRVAANIQYPLPASFVWDLSHELLDDLPEVDPLSREVMAWKVFAQLPAVLQESAFESLRHYVGEDNNGLKRWQLAARIADVLDRYQFYRPELIRSWEVGQGKEWQALLWRRLIHDVGRRHRVAVIDRLLEYLSGSGPFTSLPQRVNLFALSSLPPLFVEVIHALAAHTQVDLYLHAPTDAFWADLISQKALARKRLDKPEEADLWEVGNSLLASWGRQGQALQDLLLNHDTPFVEIDAFTEPSGEKLLGLLQRDIFELRPIAKANERSVLEADKSVQIHICHSPLRECQVLHDQLLHLLDEMGSELRAEDILVMVPDISLYAPYVEAVFDQDGARGRPFIPWNISDISVQDEHPLVLVFLQLLDLADSRFSQSEILSYLDVPELAGNFGLDSEAVAQVKTWLARANLRWGLDGDHKRRLQLPACEENTWSHARKRLFGGYALGESPMFEDIAPIGNIEGVKAEVLGKFWYLFSRLTETADRLAAPRTVEEWQIFIGGLLNDFFGRRDDEDGRLQKIREALSEFVQQVGDLDERLSPSLVRRWLGERLGSENHRGRYFSGGVTFCGMRPMRSLPFKVICVLGLQDQAFPRRDRPVEFDLMRQNWRPGDPRKGDEDRFLFLETLLCARKCLYLSYVGRDIRNNKERQPSVLVRELLDYIDQQYQLAGSEEKQRLSDRLTTVHSLQPFSSSNYDTRSNQGSYDDHWCEVARTMVRPREQNAQEPLDWVCASLSEAPERMREVSLVQLERFVRHPIKCFVNSRLQVYLKEEEAEEDEELFTVDGLRRFSLQQRLVEDHLLGREISRQQLSAEGILPHGKFAELVFEQERDMLAPLIEQLEAYKGQRPKPIPVDLEFAGDEGPRRLTGQVKGVYPGLGLLRWKPSSLKGVDILGLWLAHLAWCASGEPGDKCSILYTSKESFVIQLTPKPEVARLALEHYLGWYWQGVHQPLLVLPQASYAYTKGKQDGKSEPMKDARNQWNGINFRDIAGDKDDPYVQLVMRGVTGDPLKHLDFVALADDFYSEILSVGELS